MSPFGPVNHVPSFFCVDTEMRLSCPWKHLWVSSHQESCVWRMTCWVIVDRPYHLLVFSVLHLWKRDNTPLGHRASQESAIRKDAKGVSPERLGQKNSGSRFAGDLVILQCSCSFKSGALEPKSLPRRYQM